MRGLISGVLGGMANATNEIANTQIETNQKMDLHGQMAQIELEKQLRIDEVRRDRDVMDVGRMATATAEAAPIVAKGKAMGEIAMTSTPGYLDSLRQAQAASESSSSRATAGLTGDKRQSQAEITALRRKLSQTTNEDERAAIQQQIRDLSSSAETGAKTFGDMVAAAGHYSRMAQSLRKQAEDVYGPTEKEGLLRQAGIYENQADDILQETRGRRLGTSGTTSGQTSDIVEAVSKSGRPIIYRNGEWVYK